MSYVYNGTSYRFSKEDAQTVDITSTVLVKSKTAPRARPHKLTGEEIDLQADLKIKAAELETLFAKVKVCSKHDRADAALEKAVRLILESLAS